MKNRPEISDAELKVHKQLIRKQLLTARNNLVSQELEICNVKITKQLASLPEVQTAQTIMGYLAFGKEISIDGLLEIFLQQNKNVCVPIIVDKEKSLLEAVYLPNLESVVLGEFGIRMPMQVATCPTEDIDVVLVPGLGFSKNGARLGLGKGYYDRFLPKARKAIYIGVAAEYNLLENLPSGIRDVKMHYIVTETRIIKL